MSNITVSNIKGYWSGDLNVGATKLQLVFQIKSDANDKLSTTLNIPSKAQKVESSLCAIEDSKITINFDTIAAKYESNFDSSTKILDGFWTQANQKFELKLEKLTPEDEDKLKQNFSPKRPQTPKKPYPYVEEEVSYKNPKANIILAGSLTYPKKGTSFPAVILITGSGAEDRDETVFNHKPFLVIADYLTKNGIIVLRVDDRGVGGSTGSHAEATNSDFVSDVIAGVQYLKTRKEIDPKKIGLIGHSEGGVIAPIVANRLPEIAFIVLMAGPGIPLEQILYLQGELLLKAEKMPENEIQKQRKIQEIMFSVVKNEPNDEIAKDKIMKEILPLLPNNADPKSLPPSIQTQIKMVLSPWFRDFLDYDPQQALMKLKCPILALNGGKDLQVPSKVNLKAIEFALKRGKNTNYKVIELLGLNHLFQTAQTGGLSEYGKIEETISPVVLKTMLDWINQIVGK